MNAASIGADPQPLQALAGLVALIGATLATGMLSARLLAWDINVQSLPVLVGLGGVFVGRWLFDALGLPMGPLLGGHPVLPTLAGALAIGSVLKLASLGMARPRW